MTFIEKLRDELTLVATTHDIPTEFVHRLVDLIAVAEIAIELSEMRTNEQNGRHYMFEDWADIYEDLRHCVITLTGPGEI